MRNVAWWVSVIVSVVSLGASVVAAISQEWEAAVFFAIVSVGLTVLRMR